ncbi:MAG: hypothetical protein IRZ19_02005 [Pyrinomonas methylaliphatogenes]|nr:hypothetical protein [Pyrinomonas methylaliphatogenes]
MLRDPQLVQGGKLTEAGVAALRERFNFTDLSQLTVGQNVEELVNDLLTVRTIVDYVESKLRLASSATV